MTRLYAHEIRALYDIVVMQGAAGDQLFDLQRDPADNLVVHDNRGRVIGTILPDPDEPDQGEFIARQTA